MANFTTTQDNYACAAVSNSMIAYYKKVDLSDKALGINSLPMVRSNVADNLTTEVTKIGKDSAQCKVKFTSMQIDDFVDRSCNVMDDNMDFEPVPITSNTCSTPVKPLNNSLLKCSSIESYFKYQILRIELSACDFQCKVRSFNSEVEFMMQIMNQLILKVHYAYEREYFEGLFRKFIVCDGRGGSMRQPFYNINPEISVFSVDTKAIDVTLPATIASTLLNSSDRMSAGGTMLLLDSEGFAAYKADYLSKGNAACCSGMLQSKYVTGSNYPVIYTQEGVMLVEVPKRMIPYDPVTHQPIYPLIRPDKYYVTPINNPLAGSEVTRQFGMSESSIFRLNVPKSPMLVRMSNGSIYTTEGAIVEFNTGFGALRTDFTGVNYILGTKQADNTKFIAEGRNAVTIPANRVANL